MARNQKLTTENNVQDKLSREIDISGRTRPLTVISLRALQCGRESRQTNQSDARHRGRIVHVHREVTARPAHSLGATGHFGSAWGTADSSAAHIHSGCALERNVIGCERGRTRALTWRAGMTSQESFSDRAIVKRAHSCE